MSKGGSQVAECGWSALEGTSGIVDSGGHRVVMDGHRAPRQMEAGLAAPARTCYK